MLSLFQRARLHKIRYEKRQIEENLTTGIKAAGSAWATQLPQLENEER